MIEPVLRISIRSRIISCSVRICSILILIFLIFNSSYGKFYHRPPFSIKYSGSDDALVDSLETHLNRILPEMQERLGVQLSSSVRIHLTLTEEEFNRATRGGVPRWAGGVAYPSKNLVVVKAPLFFGQGVPLEILTAHEIAHLLIHKGAGDEHVPRWFNEGVASLAAGETRHGSYKLLNRAAASDRLMGLPRVDDVLSFSSPDAELAYAEALSAVSWLVEGYGWETIGAILKTMGHGKDFSTAFHETVGLEYENWQVEWLEHARGRYRWSLFLEIDSLIWIFIVLLGTVAVIIGFIRSRRQLRQWEEEDENDEDHFDAINP